MLHAVDATRIPDAPPNLNALERHVWYADRLRLAEIPFNPEAATEDLAALYHSHYYADGYQAPPRGPGEHSWQPIDLVGAALEPPEPPTIGGIVYPGRRHVFSGEPESLKSWAVLVLTVHELAADNTAIYIDHEMGRRDTLERLRALGATDTQIRDQLVYLEPDEPMTAPHVLPDVRDLVETRRPTLVVIDAFTGALALHGLDPNSGVEVERFYLTVIDELRRHGAAVVILDHLVKDKEARGKFSIGSERKIGAADVHLRFDVIDPFGRGLTGKAKLDTKKDRPGYLVRPRAAELELVSDPDTFAIAASIRVVEAGEETDRRHSDFRPTRLMEKVSRHLEILHEPQSRRNIVSDVQGNGDGIRKAIDKLIAEGYVTEESGPRNARLARSIRPYREDDDPLNHDRTQPLPDRTQDAVVPPLPPGPPPYGGDPVNGDEVQTHSDRDRTQDDDQLRYFDDIAPASPHDDGDWNGA